MGGLCVQGSGGLDESEEEEEGGDILLENENVDVSVRRRRHDKTTSPDIY